MEPGVNAGPPVLLERALLSLVPPLVREELAGDLWERISLTAAICCRDGTDPAVHRLESGAGGDRHAAVPAASAVAAGRARRTGAKPYPSSDRPDRVAGYPDAWRALVAALPALGALLLRNAYRPSESWTAARAIGDVAWLLIALVASQVVLALLGVPA